MGYGGIGEVTDVIIDELTTLGLPVRYPSVVTENDGTQHYEDQFKPSDFLITPHPITISVIKKSPYGDTLPPTKELVQLMEAGKVVITEF